MQKLIIKIQKDRCIGSGQCAIHAPDFFSQSAEDGIVELIQTEAEMKDFDELTNAEELCPAGVIEIEIN